MPYSTAVAHAEVVAQRIATSLTACLFSTLPTEIVQLLSCFSGKTCAKKVTFAGCWISHEDPHGLVPWVNETGWLSSRAALPAHTPAALCRCVNQIG